MSNLFCELALQIKVAQQKFQTETDLSTIIDLSLQISSGLMSQVSFERYSEIHSQCIAFFGLLREKLNEMTDKLDNQQKEDLFYLALSYEKIIPRLYVSLVVATTFENPELIEIVTDMLPAVTHPLRGYMLRYTAISFYPANSDNLFEFAYLNFCQMLILLPQINVNNSAIFDAILGLISMNISISLSSPKAQFKHVSQILEAVMLNPKKIVKMSVIISVVQTINQQLFVNNFSYFIKLFQNIEVNHESIRSALYICMKIKDANLSYQFATQTKFSDVCSEKVTKLAVDTKNYEIVQKCLDTWDNEKILMIAYEGLGLIEFMNSISPPFHLLQSIADRLLNDVTTEIPIGVVKKIISLLGISHTPEDEEGIVQMIYRNSYDHREISTLFTPDEHSSWFLFKTNQLFQIIMMNLSQSEENLDLIHMYLNQASLPDSLIDPKVRFFIICNVWPSSRAEDFLKHLRKFKDISQDDLCLVFSVFKRLNISDSIAEEYLDKCEIKNSLFAVLTYLVHAGKVNLIEKALLKLFKLDSEISNIVDRLNLYFGALNLVANLKCEKPLKIDIFQQVLDIINQTFQFSKKFSMFVLDSNNVVFEKWKEYLMVYLKSNVFALYHDKIKLIIDIYCQ